MFIIRHHSGIDVPVMHDFNEISRGHFTDDLRNDEETQLAVSRS